jgi:hypothetical protein
MMNKVNFSVWVCAFAVVCTACSVEDVSTNLPTEEQNIELRAATLGYSDAATYAADVAQQCASGNHENCELSVDGSHRVCTYADHAGTAHNGTPHSGSVHHNAHDSATCTDASHNHGDDSTHDPATCTDASHNYGGGNAHDPATCTDASHNHGANNAHDPATCTDASHNHGAGNKGHHGSGHH